MKPLLAGADSEAMKVIGEIDRTEMLPSLNARVTLAAFLALQMNRTPEQRERVLFPCAVAKYAGGRPINVDLMKKFL